MNEITTSQNPHFILILFLFVNSITLSQVGINTVDPTTVLDVNGASSLREGPVLTLSNGNNNDLNLGATPYSYYRITGPSSAFGIRNITPVTSSDGQIITLVNTTSQPMTIRNNTGGTAANRIRCPGGTDVVLSGVYATATLQYNSSLSRWVLVSTNISGGGSASNDWTTTGNAGTTPGTNYVGSSDGVDLVLATNGTENMRLVNGGQVSINNGSPALGDRFTVTGAASEYAVNGYSLGAGGVGVYGENNINGLGVWGNVGSGIGIFGTSTGAGVGVQGQNSGTGIGTIGFSDNTGVGTQGQNSGTGYGFASFNTGTGDGMYIQTTNGWGIVNVIGGNNVGIITDLTNAGGVGTHIVLDGQDGTGFNVDNSTASDVYGFNALINTLTPSAGTVYGTVYGGSQTGVGQGVIITHSGASGRNAEFDITNSSNPDPAIISISLGSGSVVVGQNQSNVLSSAITVADFGYFGLDVDDHIGLSGYSDPTSGIFNYGVGTYGYGGWLGTVGIDGSGYGDPNSYGVFSIGDSGATGTKAFTIDHPNDPENKILKHFSVESNEILNMYRGTEVFDSNGKVTVTLPDYFNDINKNPSYQLTAIGAAMPNLYVEKEISQGKFVIAGGISGKKVSWTVTSERNDLYLQQNPQKRSVEISKGTRSGKYLMPKLYGQPEESGMLYKDRKKYEASTVKPSKRFSLSNKTIPKPLKEKVDDTKIIDNKKAESQEER